MNTKDFYKYNEIISFYEKFNSPINEYLKYIKNCKQVGFGPEFNQKLDCLPDGVKKLSPGLKFNYDLNNLPSTITHLFIMNVNYCGNINFLPESLKVLVLNGQHKIEKFENLPNVKYLEVYYLPIIKNLPDSIECLILKCNANLKSYGLNGINQTQFEIINLPKSLETFIVYEKTFLMFQKEFEKIKKVLPFVNDERRMRNDGYFEKCVIFTKNKTEKYLSDYD